MELILHSYIQNPKWSVVRKNGDGQHCQVAKKLKFVVCKGKCFGMTLNVSVVQAALKRSLFFRYMAKLQITPGIF